VKNKFKAGRSCSRILEISEILAQMKTTHDQGLKVNKLMSFKIFRLILTLN